MTGGTTATNAIVGHLGTVFSSVMSWISSALNTTLSIFYDTNGLTVLGTLAVVGLAMSIFFLLVGVVSNFFHLRG